MNHTKKDIVIPVMGPTGSGKSTFINTVLGKPVMEVGKGLKSCTCDLGFGYIDPIPGYPSLKNYRVVLVDTPGFDDTYLDDAVILRKIADWLEKAYRDKAKLGGVIYLHSMMAVRFTGTARRNLDLFQSMCGQAAYSKVILGTTLLSRIPRETATDNEKQLKEDYWKTLIEEGCQVRQFTDTSQSAWGFIEAILYNYQRRAFDQIVLRIQQEIVDEKKIIPETAAGKQLRFTLQQVVEMQKKLAVLAGGRQDQILIDEAEENLNRLHSQINDLKIPFGRTLLAFLNRMRKLTGFKDT